MALNVYCKSCGKAIAATRASVNAAQNSDTRTITLRCPSCDASHPYTLQDLLEAVAASSSTQRAHGNTP